MWRSQIVHYNVYGSDITQKIASCEAKQQILQSNQGKQTIQICVGQQHLTIDFSGNCAEKPHFHFQTFVFACELQTSSGRGENTAQSVLIPVDVQALRS